MELPKLYKTVIGLDVHQAQVTACALIETADGSTTIERRQFNAFKSGRAALAQWALNIRPDVVVMESTGIYWRSPYIALERVGIIALVANARHVKNVPGRKTDVGDAQWLAQLARSGLLNGSFVAPAMLQELRLIARQRTKYSEDLAKHKNRLQKVLADGGIRLASLVSDIRGKAAAAMVQAIVDGKPVAAILALASRRFKAKREELEDAVQGDLTPSHYFVLREMLAQMAECEARIARFEERLLAGLATFEASLRLLETIPGVDRIGAALILVEIGADMEVFGNADRLASWVGLCPSNNESAGKSRSGKVRKGNRHLRRVLCECAHAASRTRCSLKVRFQTLMVRRGYKRAIVAMAHKLIRIIFFMLKRGQCYRDSAAHQEAEQIKRNAPRWLKKLAQFGYIKPMGTAVS